jgi:hypothetical protein
MVAGASLAVTLLRPAVVPSAPGALNERAWRSATHERFGSTDVYLLEDATNLYVAFSAASDRRDPNDAVKIYLWSDKAAYSFSVTAGGSKSATCSLDPKFDPNWNASEKALSSSFEVTMRIPRVLFTAGRQSRWLIQFARGTTSANILDAVAFDPFVTGDFQAESRSHVADIPKVAAVVDSHNGNGKFADQLQSLWASQGSAAVLGAPSVPDDAKGVAVVQSQQNLFFVGADAQTTDGREDSAQSLGWASSDRRLSANLQRLQTTADDTLDVTQGLSLSYDNGANLRFSGGVASDRGTRVSDASSANLSYYDFMLYGKKSLLDMRWSSVGPQYDPLDESAGDAGTNGYTVHLSRELGALSITGSADRYRDDLGNLRQADEQVKLSFAFTPSLSLDLTDAANVEAATYTSTLPYAQTGAALHFADGDRRASVSYSEDRFANGFAQQASVGAGFRLPTIGSLSLEHQQTNYWSPFYGEMMQARESAALSRRLGSDASFSIGYEYVTGTPPAFVIPLQATAGSMTFSFDSKVPIGILHATYENPNTFYPAPTFTIKLLPKFP